MRVNYSFIDKKWSLVHTYTDTWLHIFTTNHGSNTPKKRSMCPKKEENKKTVFKNIIVSNVLRGGKTIQHQQQASCPSNRAISKGIGHIFYITVMVNDIINCSLNTAVIVLTLSSIKMTPVSRF